MHIDCHTLFTILYLFMFDFFLYLNNYCHIFVIFQEHTLNMALWVQMNKGSRLNDDKQDYHFLIYSDDAH